MCEIKLIREGVPTAACGSAVVMPLRGAMAAYAELKDKS